MVPDTSLQCPWCEHTSDDADGFRTHLMVQHRKSDLATYVLHGVDRDAEPELSRDRGNAVELGAE